MRKLSRFLPFFSKAVIHFGVKPRPAQVSPFGPRYFGRAFLPLSGWTLTLPIEDRDDAQVSCRAPVQHDGNQTFSIEEAHCVERLVQSLFRDKASWIDRDGVKQPLELKDILIIAPYNSQVIELKRRLPAQARIGTVDKFQGQEAPLVIYSM